MREVGRPLLAIHSVMGSSLLQEELSRLRLDEEELKCPVCFEPETKEIFFTSPCGHYFHLDCLFNVRQRCLGKFKCPSCRTSFTESPEHSEPSSQEDGHIFLPFSLPSELWWRALIVKMMWSRLIIAMLVRRLFAEIVLSNPLSPGVAVSISAQNA